MLSLVAVYGFAAPTCGSAAVMTAGGRSRSWRTWYSREPAARVGRRAFTRHHLLETISKTANAPEPEQELRIHHRHRVVAAVVYKFVFPRTYYQSTTPNPHHTISVFWDPAPESIGARGDTTYQNEGAGNPAPVKRLCSGEVVIRIRCAQSQVLVRSDGLGSGLWSKPYHSHGVKFPKGGGAPETEPQKIAVGKLLVEKLDDGANHHPKPTPSAKPTPEVPAHGPAQTMHLESLFSQPCPDNSRVGNSLPTGVVHQHVICYPRAAIVMLRSRALCTAYSWRTLSFELHQ